MTTKRLSHKQIIISISNNNKANFMIDLSSYITNINKALRNIKLDTKADFAQLEQSDIMITTNKVAAQLNL